MNIQQYYKQAAAAALNASLVAFIPSILLLFYSIFSESYQLFILSAPFLIYSFFCYQKFLLNQNRAKASKVSTQTCNPTRQNLFDNKLLITFLPAPSLRLLLFTPNGMKVGEIRDRSLLLIRWFIPNFIDRQLMKRYGLFDHEDKPVAFYHDLKDRIEIISPENRKIAVVYKAKNGRMKEFFFETRSVLLNKGSWQDYSFISSDETQLASIQTGWMPLEWGDRFVHANTPILYMNETLSESEIVQLYSLLISMYKYGDH